MPLLKVAQPLTVVSQSGIRRPEEEDVYFQKIANHLESSEKESNK